MGLFYSLLASEDEIDNKNSETNTEVEESDLLISKEKGAYIFQDKEKRVFNFLYFKLDQEEMRKALPITYDNDENRNYLLVTFDPDGRDYLGQQSWERVQEIISNNDMINLISTQWEELPEEFKIEKQEYLNMVSLAQEQLA